MKKLTPIKSIRAFCLQCAGTSPDVKDCTANEEDIAKIAPEDDQADFIVCPLYPYRLGKRPRGVATSTQERKKIDSRSKKGHFQSIGTKGKDNA